MLPACVGIAPFGLVCGVGAAAAGASALGALGLSAIVFSGAAQILAVQLLAAGAPLAVIVLTCFVAGLRFVIYSAAMAPYQAFAASVRRFDAGGDPRGAGMYFMGGGFALWSFWQLTNIAGYFVGNLIPSAWSLEFAVPLCFIALVAPHFRSFPTISAAIVSAYAVIAFAGLPMKLNLIVAGLIGIAAGTLADFTQERWTPR